MTTKSENVIYRTSDDSISAYLAYPDDVKKHPGIVLIHAIFGLDEHIKDVANRLASQGYVVLAPHLFSSRRLSKVLTKENVSEAMKFMMSIPTEKQRDPEYRAGALGKLDDRARKAVTSVNEVLFVNRPVDLFVEYMSSGIDYLGSLNRVNGKVGSMGFCFGGGMSINLACTGRIDACVIFYGENPEPLDKVQNIKGSVLGLYGGEDTRITSKINELVRALVDYKKPFMVKTYQGAYHAFFDEMHQQTYNKEAAQDSWQLVLGFFKSSLQQ